MLGSRKLREGRGVSRGALLGSAVRSAAGGAFGARAVACALAAFACALWLAVAPVPALAAGRTGSVTMSVTAEDQKGTHTLTGDDFALVQVATASVNEGGSGSAAGVTYVMASGFEKLDRDWAALDASETAAAAHELEAAARGIGAVDAAVAAGRAAHVGTGQTEIGFWGLEPGLYLVVRTGVASANKGLAMDPVLVGVPLLEDGAFTYHVRVTPKFEWTGEDHPGNGGSETPGGGTGGSGSKTPGFLTPGWLPKTGDYAAAIVLVLALAGACALVAGRRLRRSR